MGAIRHQGTAAGKGSAASLEFLEQTLDRARERQQRNETDVPGRNEQSQSTPLGPVPGQSETGRGATPTGEGEGSAEEKNGDATGGASSDEISPGEGRQGGTGGVGVGAGAGRLEASGGGRAARVGWSAGFGVVGVEGTVELALQALSKVRVEEAFLEVLMFFVHFLEGFCFCEACNSSEAKRRAGGGGGGGGGGLSGVA